MKPCVLNGNWKCGWALDLHTISSEHLGGGGALILNIQK